MKQKIGIIGVGRIGSALANNLLSAGFTVIAHDLDAGRVEAIARAGGGTVSSPDQIVSQVDVLLLSLPKSQDVLNAVRDAKLFEQGKRGLVVLNASTIDHDVSADLVAQLRQKNGIEMLEATVSGTPEMCAARENIFMVGGRREAFEQCQSIFTAMSGEAFYTGDTGSGLAIKLVVNLVLSLNRMALAEGLTLAQKAGLDPAQTLAVLKKSAAYSKAMDQKGERMVKRQFVPASSRIANTIKSLRLVLDMGARLDCPLPLLSLNVQALASEVSKGRSEWDSANIISFYRELANIQPGTANPPAANSALKSAST